MLKPITTNKPNITSLYPAEYIPTAESPIIYFNMNRSAPSIKMPKTAAGKKGTPNDIILFKIEKSMDLIENLSGDNINIHDNAIKRQNRIKNYIHSLQILFI